MTTEFLLGTFFVIVIVVFAACMFLIPELMGISKTEGESQNNKEGAENSSAEKGP